MPKTRRKRMTVLVIGATGTIASRVAQELLEQGDDVRGTVRDASRATALPVGVRPAIADLDDASAVNKALGGIDRVVLIAANSFRQAEQEGNVIEAARRSGVEHLVKLSVGGASPDAGLALARAHWAAEKQLQESGVPFTIIRPGFFMQNLLQYASWIEADGAWRLPMGESPIAMVHANDVAQVIASVVRSEPFAEDVNVTGGASLTMAQAATAIGLASGRPIRYIDGEPDAYFAQMVAAGNDEQYARDMTVLYDQVIRAGYAGAVSGDVQKFLHRDPLDFGHFAAESAPIFRAGALIPG
jgi:uncharacterized protein YbjT (DUF2867 family)